VIGAPPGDVATVTVFVDVTPEDAFDVFTRETDSWWGQGPKFRIGGRRRGRIAFEGGQGGRLFETFEHASGSRTFDVGKITVWEPPSLLVFEWRGVNFKSDEKTLVEVSFSASGEGTMVRVRHSGWSTLRDGHPARHGLEGPAFSRMIGLWWGALMGSLRELTAARREPTEKRDDSDS
jgi:uncharacterized protein YndB with AHSA1/START domain